MAFASTDDIADWLGRDLSAGEEQSVALRLTLATGCIAAACDKDDAWAEALDPVPTMLRAVCIEIVARTVGNPNALASLQESLGQHSYSARFRAEGIALTEREELLVRREVFGTSSGSTRPLGTIDELHDLYYS